MNQPPILHLLLFSSIFPPPQMPNRTLFNILRCPNWGFFLVSNPSIKHCFLSWCQKQQSRVHEPVAQPSNFKPFGTICISINLLSIKRTPMEGMTCLPLNLGLCLFLKCIVGPASCLHFIPLCASDSKNLLQQNVSFCLASRCLFNQMVPFGSQRPWLLNHICQMNWRFDTRIALNQNLSIEHL